MLVFLAEALLIATGAYRIRGETSHKRPGAKS
jgi:hypothetical protein